MAVSEPLAPQPLAPLVPGEEPTRHWLVVCAWCQSRGRARTSVRPPSQRRWAAVSHGMAWVLKRAGMASHGVCAQCAAALRREWA